MAVRADCSRPDFGALALARETLVVFVRGAPRIVLVGAVYGVAAATLFSATAGLLVGFASGIAAPGAAARPETLPLPMLALLLLTGVSCLGLFWGVLQLAAVDAALGARRSIADYGRRTAAVLPAFVLLGTANFVAIACGLVLLVLPGLLIMAALVAWPAILLHGNGGWRSLDRALALSRGRRWPILGAWLLVVLPGSMLLNLASQLLGAALPPVGDGGLAAALIGLGQVATGLANSLLPTVFAAAAYICLGGAAPPDLPPARAPAAPWGAPAPRR